MEVEFELTVEDHLALALYYQSTSAKVRRARKVVTVVLALVAAGGVCLMLLGPTGMRVIGALMVAFSALYLSIGFVPALNRLFNRDSVRRSLAEGEGLGVRRLGLFKVALSPEGISEETEHFSGLLRWSGVERIGQTADHLFIFIGLAMGIPIPRRAFASDTNFAAFAAEAERCLNAARSRDVSAAPQGIARE